MSHPQDDYDHLRESADRDLFESIDPHCVQCGVLRSLHWSAEDVQRVYDRSDGHDFVTEREAERQIEQRYGVG